VVIMALRLASDGLSDGSRGEDRMDVLAWVVVGVTVALSLAGAAAAVRRLLGVRGAVATVSGKSCRSRRRHETGAAG
jgi:hypothetical protein